MVELEPTTPNLKTKTSTRCLNAPAGGRPKSRVGLGRSATISTPSPPSSSSSKSTSRSSPGRGGKLTVRIEDDMTSYAQLIKSAPVKTIRKLPVPPMPATAVECSVNGSLLSVAPRSDYAEPYSAPASLHPPVQSPLTPRMVRPLPSPPYLPNEAPRTLTSTLTPTHARTRSLSPSPPIGHVPVRVIKPLPVPVVKIEPMVLPWKEEASSRPVPSTPPSLSPTSTPTPTRPRRTAENVFVQEKPRTELPHPEEAQMQSQPQPKREPNVIHLKLRHRPTLSLDSDTSTSEDDEYGSEAEPTFRHSRVTIRLEDRKNGLAETSTRGLKSPRLEFDDDLENLVDYTWMLSNRKLYRLDALSSQQMTGGKWLWEKKGKRITEQDFENILHMLRTL
ncbi:hypothetical protein CPB84DRAFT_1789431 [Gymnopilus junonius]|uniref:Uncharacterized protein n=1 Tax=Gymnopilus junonius TaxID=109634 RepID=A0A9P5NEU9_GYMJU|nr:hypothetical protein CPB84DRAFT_1789431 [Gymnopilus junonius]